MTAFKPGHNTFRATWECRPAAQGGRSIALHRRSAVGHTGHFAVPGAPAGQRRLRSLPKIIRSANIPRFELTEEEARLSRIDVGVDPLAAAALLLGPCFQRAFIHQVTGQNPMSAIEHEFVTGLVATLMVGLAPSGPKSGRRHRAKTK
jgi:hypothetical protein